MAIPEVATSQEFLLDALDRLVALTEGLDAEQLNWRPAPEANSLYVLGTHVLGSVEETILSALCRARSVQRDRDAEFASRGDEAAQFAERWRLLRPEVEQALDALTAGDLDAARMHRRFGAIPGRQMLVMATCHAQEHMAHAELTRQLLDARAG